MQNIVVVDCIRTGLAKAHRGTFNLTRSDDLVAHCIDALLERNPQLDPETVEDVILGCGRHRPTSAAMLLRCPDCRSPYRVRQSAEPVRQDSIPSPSPPRSSTAAAPKS